jgi:hypothetical protein
VSSTPSPVLASSSCAVRLGDNVMSGGSGVPSIFSLRPTQFDPYSDPVFRAVFMPVPLDQLPEHLRDLPDVLSTYAAFGMLPAGSSTLLRGAVSEPAAPPVPVAALTSAPRPVSPAHSWENVRAAAPLPSTSLGADVSLSATRLDVYNVVCAEHAAPTPPGLAVVASAPPALGSYGAPALAPSRHSLAPADLVLAAAPAAVAPHVAPTPLPPPAKRLTAATVLALEDLAAQSSAGLTPKILAALRARSLNPSLHGPLGTLEDILVRMAVARTDHSPSPVSKVSSARFHRSASLLRALRLPDDDSRSGWDTVLGSARAAWQKLLHDVSPAPLASSTSTSGSVTSSASLAHGGGGGPGPRRTSPSSRNGPGRELHFTPHPEGRI